jgi:hypothetical protein
VKYKQRSRSTSKDGWNNSTSDQDKIKKMLSPEEILKLSSGKCIFINPAYSNPQEASIPLSLKVNIGDSEMQRRAYSEAKFDLVMGELRSRVKHHAITEKDIHLRIFALAKVIPDASIMPTSFMQNLFADITKELMG